MKKKVWNILKLILCCLISSFFTILLLKCFGYLDYDHSGNLEDSISFNESVAKVYDAVVAVEGYKNDELDSSGSGTIYKKEDGFGYIITNYHVIDQMDYIYVITNSGDTVRALVVGSDESSDIALIKIDDSYVSSIAKIGKSDQLKIGDTVFTVGSPVDRKYIGSVTKGIVSGLNRKITISFNGNSSVLDVIQTDAAINPGNSGGPLCNIDGDVIGITSLKLSNDNVEGIGFAIPIENVMSVISLLEK